MRMLSLLWKNDLFFSNMISALYAMPVVLFPAIIGYGLSWVCPVGKGHDTSESAIPFRPPAWVFGVVWPVLYILLGVSLFLSLSDPILLSLHALIVLALAAWIPVTSCWGMKREGMWILVACVLACAYAMLLSKRSALLLAPLLVWVSFAVLMSAWQIGAHAASQSMRDMTRTALATA